MYQVENRITGEVLLRSETESEAVFFAIQKEFAACQEINPEYAKEMHKLSIDEILENSIFEVSKAEELTL